MRGVGANPSLDFEPYAGSFLFAPLRRLPTVLLWASVCVFAAIPVVAALLQHALWGDGLAPWAPFQLQFGIGTVDPGIANFPLGRDICSLLLIVLISLTVVCVREQWRAISTCIADLESSGALKWREAPAQTSSLYSRIAPVGICDSSADCREQMRAVLERYSGPNRTRDVVTAVLSVLGALLLTMYLERSDMFLGLAPPLSEPDRLNWAAAAYGNWWASWEHPLGAIVYAGLLAVGLYVILSQNFVALLSIRILLIARVLSTPEVDWLNIDGAYGWRPLQRVFRTAYLSTGLRALQLVVLVALLELHDLALLSAIAAIWLAFLAVYIAYPYFFLRGRVRDLKDAQLRSLASHFSQNGYCVTQPTDATRNVVEEIGRIQAAVVNPMQLARWQSSSFSAVVLLPVVLTAVQIAT